MAPYTFWNTAADAVEIPASGLRSRVLLDSPALRIVGLGFAAGHTLAEHTAPGDAVLCFARGQGTVTLDADTQVVQAGSMVHMPAGLRHAVHAETELVLLLILVKGPI